MEQHLSLEAVYEDSNYKSRIWKNAFIHSASLCQCKIAAYGYFFGRGGGDGFSNTSLNFLVLKYYTWAPDQTFLFIVFPYHFESRLSEKFCLLMVVKSAAVVMNTEKKR